MADIWTQFCNRHMSDIFFSHAWYLKFKTCDIRRLELNVLTVTERRCLKPVKGTTATNQNRCLYILDRTLHTQSTKGHKNTHRNFNLEATKVVPNATTDPPP